MRAAWAIASSQARDTEIHGGRGEQDIEVREHSLHHVTTPTDDIIYQHQVVTSWVMQVTREVWR